MSIFKNPKWINFDLYKVKEYQLLDNQLFDEINQRLSKINSDIPEVSIVISAWNEELNIIKCIDSLSKLETSIPFEIIVVNNNSSDNTQLVLDKLKIQSYFQPKQGCGISRQLGQEKANGKYILLADADCYYPKKWLDNMYNYLIKDEIAVVYSRHSFLGNENTKRWKYFLYELGKDIIIELRNIKRPYLNCYGMSMGFLREQGLKEGFVLSNIRGEDGRMCFDLMKYGKVKLVRNRHARVWTSDRNFEKDGNVSKAIYKRILREIDRAKNYFTKPVAHDTKTSQNTEKSKDEYEIEILSKLKNKVKIK